MFFGTYIHPVNSPFYNNKDYSCTLELIEQFILSQIEQGSEYHYIVGGDLNARIGDWCVEAEEEEDVASHGHEIYTRSAKDPTINNFGRNLIEFCTSFEMTPLSGLVRKNFVSEYTFLSVRGCSIIDHYICSLDILEYVTDYKVMQRVESAHLPIIMTLQGATFEQQVKKQKKTYIRKYKWEPEKEAIFLTNMNSTDTDHKIEQVKQEIDTDIDHSISMLTEAILEAGNCMKQSIMIGGGGNKSSNAWFDTDCKKKKEKLWQL